MASDKHGFFEELKRRHVWRMVAAYAIAAWLLVKSGLPTTTDAVAMK